MGEERGPGAEDALGILLVVDGESLPAGQGQVIEQRVDVGDGPRGPGPQAGLGADGPDGPGVQGGQDGLPGRGGVGDLALPERGVEAEAAARARLTAAYEQFMAEGDPARKSEVGEDLIRAIFGRAAIAEDSLR